MKQRILAAVFAVFLLVGFQQAAFAADVMLPSPDKQGGIPVLKAIADRASAKSTSFDKKEIANKDLSTMLWAGSGLNRAKGWTIPLGQGADPYVDIYVLLKTGVYTYDWQKNSLLQVNSKNLISRASSQGFVATAPCVLVFATNGGRTRVDSWAEVAVGAMTQNIYLACEALGLKARYAATFNKDTLLNNFETAGPMVRIVAIMPVGYQK